MKQRDNTKLSQEDVLLKVRYEALINRHLKHMGTYKGLKVIHRHKMRFTETLSSLIDQYNPTLFIFDFSDYEMDKIWSEDEVNAIISFDDLEMINDEELFEVWLSEDVTCGLGMISGKLKKEQLICYWEGKSEKASLWREIFESKLTD